MNEESSVRRGQNNVGNVGGGHEISGGLSKGHQGGGAGENHMTL